MNARKIYPVAHQSRWEYRLAAVTRSGAFAGLEIPLEVGADSLRDAIRTVRAARIARLEVIYGNATAAIVAGLKKLEGEE